MFSRTKNYPTASLDQNSFEFEFQTDLNVHVDLRQTYFALKVKLVEGRGFDSYKTTEKKKKHTEDTVFTETGDCDIESMEEGEGVPHIKHVNNILHSNILNAELYINNHQIYNPNALYAHKSHISGNFKSTLTEYKGVLPFEGHDYEENPENILESLFYYIGITISKNEKKNQTNSIATKFLNDKRASRCKLGFC